MILNPRKPEDQIAKLTQALRLIGATAEKIPDPDHAKAKWLLKLHGLIARHTLEEIETEIAAAAEKQIDPDGPIGCEKRNSPLFAEACSKDGKKRAA